MSEQELRREMAVLPISVIRELTGLSDRQIRYYDQQGLIAPKRGAGKQRRYSLNDVDRLLEIADYLDAGYTISEIHEVEDKQKAKRTKNATEAQLRKALQGEFMQIGRLGGQGKR
ncbi:MerR family transcriptional regulator [Weissella diestrammenae]|uniref:MerR family transcriptional regulator n=1 Tax=Weissella diestrammenae TaxID=1162633 RepID=A0A7G9T3U6_9LACO|nr:MerR family transcriptional regulator [Weissella diestrammenae]MCM0582758.1 MerR family transcriptional regulator [Weissella diestrammenae]QNN74771.1 MerR family transcriptional regulator [Weissella diestrammenae]